MMKTAVVILNWNTRDLLERFLPGLIASVEGEGDAEVIVADNASDDGSVEMMAEKFPSVRTIVLDRNYGFAEGYDRALEDIEAEYFVLINSDVEVSAGWLGPLTEWMDSHPECGACGPKLHSWYERDRFEYAGAAGGYIDRYGYPFCRGRVLGMTETDNGQYDEPKDVLWVSGACLMVRSELFRKLGGFDRRFFAHMEEIDLCWRIQLAGYRVTALPFSTVYHLGGGTLPMDSPSKLKLNHRNNLLMLDNNLALTVGKAKASRIMMFRRFLDGCTALAYLCCGKTSRFRALRQAHKEYRLLRKETGGTCRLSAPAGHVTGIYGGFILLQAMLKREKVFGLIGRIGRSA